MRTGAKRLTARGTVVPGSASSKSRYCVESGGAGVGNKVTMPNSSHPRPYYVEISTRPLTLSTRSTVSGGTGRTGTEEPRTGSPRTLRTESAPRLYTSSRRAARIGVFLGVRALRGVGGCRVSGRCPGCPLDERHVACSVRAPASALSSHSSLPQVSACVDRSVWDRVEISSTDCSTAQ